MAAKEETTVKKASIFTKELTRKNGKTKYPTKQTINLVIHENEKRNKRSILYFCIFLVALAIFVRVAVFGLLDRLSAAEAQYNVMKSQLDEINAMNGQYDEIKKQYDEVTDWYMTDEEKMEVDKTGVFAMLKDDLFPYVTVTSVAITGNQITIQTGETDLATVSKFIAVMQSDSRNSYVTVSTTNASGISDNTQNNQVIAAISVTYAGGSAGGEA